MKVLFVTGKLAAPLLRDTLDRARPDFAYDVAVMKITVAALMTPEWIARFLDPPHDTDLILLPGLIRGDPGVLEARCGIRTEKGPPDLRDIPAHFGLADLRREYGEYDVQIIAEINDAPRRTLPEMLGRAAYFADAGADLIDVGCSPGDSFPGLGDVVRALRAGGHRVSVDSFDPDEIRAAVAAGAELVLSVNAANIGLARELDATFVVIPDFDGGLDTLDKNIETLESWDASYIVDPILEPFGYGAAESLHRYYDVRQRYPTAELLMGTANLTELTEADTTGMHALLLGYCQELGIRHVLTTEEIPWARGSVHEIDVARRLMHHAIRHRSLPKHMDPRLVTVKDPEINAYSEKELRSLQAQITDPNYRIFADEARIYVFNSDRFVSGTDISELFAQLDVEEASHAFYLGKELMKARLAISLGKTYRQEAPLSWGYLTPAGEGDEGASDDGASDDARATQREQRLRAQRERADRRRAAARSRQRGS